jgi:hypothetical protein
MSRRDEELLFPGLRHNQPAGWEMKDRKQSSSRSAPYRQVEGESEWRSWLLNRKIGLQTTRREAFEPFLGLSAIHL